MPKREIEITKLDFSCAELAREKLDSAKVAEYAERIIEGDEFPELEAIQDGKKVYVYDGRHRAKAYEKAGLGTVPVNVEKGTLAGARIKARGANRRHGMPMSNADKRLCVDGMLADVPEWSDRRIADHVGVGNKFVSDRRAIRCVPNTPDEPQSRVGIDGKTYTVPRPKLSTSDATGGASDKGKAVRQFFGDHPHQREPGDESEPTGDDPIVATPALEPQALTVSIVRDALERVVPQYLTFQHAGAASILSAATKLDAVKHAVQELAEQPGGEFLGVSAIADKIAELKGLISHARYYTECPACKGTVSKDCSRCDGNGYLPYSRRTFITEDELSWLKAA